MDFADMNFFIAWQNLAIRDASGILTTKASLSFGSTIF
jgi:hypothetical protein